MAQINVGEMDFQYVAEAANRAEEVGDGEQAKALDKIARKINAALSNEQTRGQRALSLLRGLKGETMTWQEAPSVLGRGRGNSNGER